MVNTTEIGTVYDSLIAKMKTTLDAEYDSSRINSADYASLLGSTINGAIQASIQSVQQQPILDADEALKIAQELLVDAQTTTEGSRDDLLNIDIDLKEQKIVGRRQAIPA